MPEKTSEKNIERDVDELLKTAEDYLWRAKVNKSKDSQNFEVALALEYVTKARDRSKQLMHVKEFYDNAYKRTDLVIDELSKLRTTFARRKSYSVRFRTGFP